MSHYINTLLSKGEWENPILGQSNTSRDAGIPIFPDLRQEEQERIITELRNFVEKEN